MSITFKGPAAKENLPRTSVKFGICARNGIMPIQSKVPGLAMRSVAVPVRAKVAGVAPPSHQSSGQQRTVLKEIHNRTGNVEALAKRVNNISIRPKAEAKPLKPLQSKDKAPAVVTTKVKARSVKVVAAGSSKSKEDVGRVAVVASASVPLVVTKPAAAAGSGKVDISSYSAQLLQVQVENIDAADDGNIMLVTNYIDDIYKYLYQLEEKFPIECNHLKDCTVTPKMRSILVNWMVDVHTEFHLLAETLFLSVAIMDRFLQVDRTVNQKNLQLVGSTAMFVASKYEEMLPPDVSDFVYVSGQAFSKHDVMSMEMKMLQALDFSLGRPLPIHFLRRFSKAAHATTEIHTKAKYALELCLMEYTMCHVPPSLLAAAALYTSRYIVCAGTQELWTATLHHYSHYCETEVLPVARKMAALMLTAEARKHKAVFAKYATTKFEKVSQTLDRARLKRLASP